MLMWGLLWGVQYLISRRPGVGTTSHVIVKGILWVILEKMC